MTTEHSRRMSARPAEPAASSRRSAAGPVGLARSWRRPRALPAVAVVALGAVTVLASCGDADGGARGERSSRQAEVARRGAEVMPFDLDATTHRFQPVDDGLVQTVVADDPGDEEQVALVRDHLEAETEAFVGGDYGDPATIHGDDMPGLAELEAGAAEITVVYEPTDDGGRITYTTARPALVEALHRWAEAQVSDHGEHAEHS